MRVIVCGGRDFHDWRLIDEKMSQIDNETPIEVVIHGNARGADTLAGEWASRHSKRVWPVPAQWSKHGKRAGPIRNQSMLGMGPEMVIAFPGGRGTADMIKRAKRAGVRVLEV